MKIKWLLLSGALLLMLSVNLYAAGGVVKGANEVAPDRYVYYPRH